MANPAYPNVPDAVGVPKVLRDGTNPPTPPVAAADGDTITVTATGFNQWGIYTQGNAKALEPDTIMSVGFDAEHRIADYPLEEGGFESYDKVALPYSARVTMTKGGSRFDRRDFLAKLEVIRGDLELYNVVTPEKTYRNVNIGQVSIDRSREAGVGLITVQIMLREIRQNAETTFSKTKDPASADDVNGGSVQATPSTQSTGGIQ